MTDDNSMVLILEKRTYLIKTIKLFKQNNEIGINEIKNKITSRSYYHSLLPKILEINLVLEDNSLQYFIKPVFLKKCSQVLSGLKINPFLNIDFKDKFILIRSVRDLNEKSS